MVSPEWNALGGIRRTLARMVYARDSSTPGYVCPGGPGRPCGLPIDWALEWPDRMSRSVDHVVELQDGGDLTDLRNLSSVHLTCNATKGITRRHERAREAKAAARSIMIDPSTL